MSRKRLVLGLILISLVLVMLPPKLIHPMKNAFFLVTQPILMLLGLGSQGLTRSTNKVSSSSRAAGVPKSTDIRLLRFENEELVKENNRLRRLIDFDDTWDSRRGQIIVSEVIGRSPAGWRDTLLINKGSHHDIKKDMPVMTIKGLLGKIVEVSPFTSKVYLITHPRFRVGALIQRNRHTGVVYGTSDGSVRMKYISLDADVRPGDLVETAAFSEIFPKGILIGEIATVRRPPGQLYKIASIRLAADIFRLEEVICIDVNRKIDRVNSAGD